jgi:hypothetical protein
MHQVIHAFPVFQQVILIFEGVSLNDLVLLPTLHHVWLILRVPPHHIQ